VGVLGATSFVGECLFPLITRNGWRVLAFSRKRVDGKDPHVVWSDPRQTSLAALPFERIERWICVAPLWVTSEYLELMASAGAKRVVALSSTSRFTKSGSSDGSERVLARRLAEAESHLQRWAEQIGIEWIILRPTMIYGFGRDENLTEIARFIRRFGFFPLFGKANGLRQPIHAHDVASACIAALQTRSKINRAYDLSGAEILPYREMVARVFAALGRPPRMVPVPLPAFRFAIALLRCLPRYHTWTPAMAERMNQDLAFDHSDAKKDLAFQPRPFSLSEEDLPA
jgi:nucleoside-diphosphate-sugar epimerase